MTRLPSLFGWLHANTRRRLFAGVALLLVSREAPLVSQSLPATSPPKASAEMTHQLIIGAGAAASGPGGPRVTMRVEYVPFGRQALLIGMSAEEQVGTDALMLIAMPASHRFGRYRIWAGPGAAFNDEPSWVGLGGLSREFGVKGNDMIVGSSLNRIRNVWQWSLTFSFVNEKW